MCGIVFTDLMRHGRATKAAFQRYKGQEKRGTLGFGCVTVCQGKVENVFRSETEKGIKKALDSRARMVLFHHRFPTSTPNLAECTHPIYVSHKCLDFDYYVVHNGVISNAERTKKKFEEQGFVYNTEVQVKTVYKIKGKEYLDEEYTTKFNDSESFAIDIAIAIEDEAAKIESEGSIAFVALQVCKKTQKVLQVFYGRNLRNPLKIDSVQHDHFTLASEGSGTDVKEHTLFSYNPQTREIKEKPLEIGYVYHPPVTTTHSYESRRESTYGFLNGINRQQELFPKREEPSKKLTDETVTLKDMNGKEVTIRFKMEGDYLQHTRVHKDDLGIIVHAEWHWYRGIIEKTNELATKLAENSKLLKETYGSMFDEHYDNKLKLQKEMSTNNIQYTYFTDVVKRRRDKINLEE